MKVAHIIPGAFDYFNDIYNAAFDLADDLHAGGVELDVFTLEYNYFGQTPSPKQRGLDAKEKVAPSVSLPKKRHYAGGMNARALLENLKNYDIVHLHAPFLGAGRGLLKWLLENPQIIFVITYHRPVVWEDLLSVFIGWYNRYYLKRLGARADLITNFGGKKDQWRSGIRYAGGKNKFLDLTVGPFFTADNSVLTYTAKQVKLIGAERIKMAETMAEIYFHLAGQRGGQNAE